MSKTNSTQKKNVHVIGFGAVGRAWLKKLRATMSRGHLDSVEAVNFWALEITEKKTEGKITFNPAPPITKDNLSAILDGMNLRKGDVLMELATRIDTRTIWKEVKARGCHFVNSGYDVWPDAPLDLEGLDALQKDEAFSKGKGLTCVFTFGCNPGIASHFVRHGLKMATGISDARLAAREFGLKSISFNERDTQWPVAGSASERRLIEGQLDTLHNTWSPGNFLVETAESNILFAGCPEEAKSVNAGGPAVVGWVPSGPNVGFMAPHDETFTIQSWFDHPIPAVFVYEAPPCARAYLKAGRKQHSSKCPKRLVTPKEFELASTGSDVLGALMFSSKPGVAPFWCGIQMDVNDAKDIDPMGEIGPTPFQVTGGLWTALNYCLEHPNDGDLFPEDVPSDFVMTKAFPWAGKLVARPAPEALEVPGLFDPGNAKPEVMSAILGGEAQEGRAVVKQSAIGGKGTFAAKNLPVQTAFAQLPYEPYCLIEILRKGLGTPLNHSCTPNAYIDRNRSVRAARNVKAGEELTVDFSLYHTCSAAPFSEPCRCGAQSCRKVVGPASTLPKNYLAQTVRRYAVWGDERLAGIASGSPCRVLGDNAVAGAGQGPVVTMTATRVERSSSMTMSFVSRM